MPRVIAEAPRVEKQIVCNNCGRTIAYVNNDIRTDYDIDYTGSRDSYRYVQCPAEDCRKQIRVS